MELLERFSASFLFMLPRYRDGATGMINDISSELEIAILSFVTDMEHHDDTDEDVKHIPRNKPATAPSPVTSDLAAMQAINAFAAGNTAAELRRAADALEVAESRQRAQGVSVAMDFDAESPMAAATLHPPLHCTHIEPPPIVPNPFRMHEQTPSSAAPQIPAAARPIAPTPAPITEPSLLGLTLIQLPEDFP